MYMHVNVCICMHVCIYVCMHARMQVCMHIFMYACMNVCVHVFIFEIYSSVYTTTQLTTDNQVRIWRNHGGSGFRGVHPPEIMMHFPLFQIPIFSKKLLVS